ncbi:MAG TPA: class I SAM-dependent methyltransferase [Pyrinomonadaceae bacterium]|nr:class I SAM-dependent methyltransferase [Pyrinomonadaceae bacterium]
MTGQPAGPSPVHFFETINAYQRSATLKAAIELGVFTAIAEGAQTAETIAQKCDASERGTRILCDYLVIIGFLTKEENRYGLTQDSAIFLNRNSPAYVGGSIEFLLAPMLTEGFKDVAAVVRKGGTIIPEEGTTAPEHPIWVKFARAMAPLAALSAQSIAELLAQEGTGARKVLDIAAGHGLYGIAVAGRNPDAQIFALDWPNVLEVAQENAARAGIEGRYNLIAGSAFEADFGGGYDTILLTNFLHHFDAPTCEGLLRKIHSALADGGRVATLEMIPNEDRVSPPVDASFSLMMLGGTPGGDAYTFSELEAMFKNAGFTSSELHSLPATFQRVVISRK